MGRDKSEKGKSTVVRLSDVACRNEGIAEIFRVLGPGGVTRIYDVVDWIRRFEQGGSGITEIAQASPFAGDGETFTRSVTIRLGPIPIVYLAELRRKEPGAIINRGDELLPVD